MIKLELSVEEVNNILALMGETPAKLGYFLLMQKIKMQADPQVEKKTEE